MERRNVKSDLLLPEYTTAFAHTRWRTVFRPEVSLHKPDSNNTVQGTVWTGSMTEIKELKKAMERALLREKGWTYPLF